jgi:pyruvate/2-oxoacid:ferredoxin oxidoreductase alpha subunit
VSQSADPGAATTLVIEGTHAISYAVQRCRARVVAAYPITPSSGVVELLSEMCADGRLDARFVAVESEHSAMATLAGAAQTGARSFTATSSHGLAYMHEMLHWCAGARLPIVLANVNRAMGTPWNIFVDQNDSLSQRDTGWMQFYCENNQEVFDTILQAYRVAEQVQLPAMVCLDAFFLSHTSEPVSIPDQFTVDAYLPPFRPEYRLDPARPHAFGGYTGADGYMELRAHMESAMRRAVKAVADADEQFGRMFGRRHHLVEPYRADDAELLLVASGTVAGTARAVVDEYRARGVRLGLARIRLFRPFPFDALYEIVAGVPKVAVFDRNVSFGHGGIMASEIKSALHGVARAPRVFSFVGGLGGRDVTPDTLGTVIDYTLAREAPEHEMLWLGLKSRP